MGPVEPCPAASLPPAPGGPDGSSASGGSPEGCEPPRGGWDTVEPPGRWRNAAARLIRARPTHDVSPGVRASVADTLDVPGQGSSLSNRALLRLVRTIQARSRPPDGY